MNTKSISLGLVVIVACVVGLISYTTFAPSTDFDFVMFDDDINLYQNPHLGAVDGTHLEWAFTDSTYMHRFMPLSWVALCALFEHAGLDPHAYHTANVLLHAVNGVLVFLIVNQLLILLAGGPVLRELRLVERTAIAATAAVAWALHPLRVEVVAWASGILYLQAAAFALMSALCFLRSCSADGRRRLILLILSALAYTASILSYPVALGWPIALIAFEIWRRTESHRSKEKRKDLPAIVALASCLLASLMGIAAAVRARQAVTTYWDAPPGLSDFTLGDRLMNACYTALYYVWSMLPIHPLSPVYEQLDRIGPSRAGLIGSCIIVAAVVLAIIWKRRRIPGAVLWTVAFVGVSMPFYGLLDAQFQPCDRYTYIPGVVMLAGVAFLLANVRRTARGLAILCLLGFTVFSARLIPEQLAVWRDSPALFAHITDHLRVPDKRGSYVARHAVYEARMGRFERAAQVMDNARATVTDQRLILPYENIIASLRRRAAEVSNTRVVPAAIEAHALAIQSVQQQNNSGAVAHFRRSVYLDPDYMDARFNFGLWLARHGQIEDALGQYSHVAGSTLTAELHVRLVGEIRRAAEAQQRKRIVDACDQALARLEGGTSSGQRSHSNTASSRLPGPS